jgi:hypothetical protein
VKETTEGRQPGTPPKDRRILQKITEANDLFFLWGEALRADPRISSLLKNLEGKIADSVKAMHDCGVVEACRRCDQEEGGSCCGAGIENRYTPRPLLINLLLGQTLPERRRQPEVCFFLSESGCCLDLRQVLCVNYLCLKIQTMLPQDELVRLQQITGEEMETAFILEEAVKKFVDQKESS